MSLPLLAERGDDLARGVDTESWPQDRQIEPNGTVFGEAIAAPADRTNEADRVEYPVTQRVAACTLRGALGFLDKAADAQQPVEEWKRGEQAQIGPSDGAQGVP